MLQIALFFIIYLRIHLHIFEIIENKQILPRRICLLNKENKLNIFLLNQI